MKKSNVIWMTVALGLLLLSLAATIPGKKTSQYNHADTIRTNLLFNVADIVETTNKWIALVELPGIIGTMGTPTMAVGDVVVTNSVSCNGLTNSGVYYGDGSGITNLTGVGGYGSTITLAYSGGTNVVVNCALGSVFKLSATNDFYLTFSNVSSAGHGWILVKQDTQGVSNNIHTSFLVNPLNVVSNSTLFFTTNAGALDKLEFWRDDTGTNLLVNLATNFLPSKWTLSEANTNAPGECAVWVSCTNNDNYIGTNACQKIKVTAPTTICKVAVYVLGNGAGVQTFFRTDYNWGGTQIAASDSVVQGAAWAWVTNTFDPPITLTTDSYLYMNGASWWGEDTANSGATYEGADYSIWTTIQAPDWDLNFVLFNQ